MTGNLNFDRDRSNLPSPLAALEDRVSIRVGLSESESFTSPVRWPRSAPAAAQTLNLNLNGDLPLPVPERMLLLGLERGTPFGTMGKGRGRCENGASLHDWCCEKLH